MAISTVETQLDHFLPMAGAAIVVFTVALMVAVSIVFLTTPRAERSARVWNTRGRVILSGGVLLGSGFIIGAVSIVALVVFMLKEGTVPSR